MHSSQAARLRVVVTGAGVVSPIGTNMQAAWTSLLSGVSGISQLKEPDYEQLPCKVAGRVPELRCLLETNFSSSKLRTMSPATGLALLAAQEALTAADWCAQEEEGGRTTGVAVGVGMVDLEEVCRSNDELRVRGYKRVSPYFVPRILPNMAAGQISMQHGLRGPNHAVSTACATGAHAIGDALRFIRNGDASVMVCGGAESCISPLAIAGFCRLRALSTSFNDDPSAASRPFDKQRDGFVMGEGSAILVLEELNHALRRSVPILGEILGYGLSGDAAHLTAPSDDGAGALHAMRRALQDAGVSREDVGYVNAHATSTPLGDEIEAKAIRSLFGEHTRHVQVSSTKGSHGHLLGAAGNLESVFTVLACQSGVIPPSINLHQPGHNIDITLVANKSAPWVSKIAGGRRIALKNAFGFGGTNACLCIAEYK